MFNINKQVIYPLILGISTLLSPISTYAQEDATLKTSSASMDTITLEGFIDADKSLTSGKIYLIKHNVKIDANATLTVPANATILFSQNTTIVVEGGLNINGTPNNLVELKSLNSEFQGDGITIRNESDDKSIKISYANFSGLKMPLQFDMDWYRPSVTIENNIFKGINTGETAISISSPLVTFQNTTNKKVEFIFSKNNFVNNWASIFIENFQDNIMDLRFKNNLLTNNVVYGLDKGIPSNTPLFGIYDKEDKRFNAQINDNSIYGNYQINASNDTVIREIGIGIQGSGEKYTIDNNFFRSNDNEYISSTFDHFYQNNSLPLLISSNTKNKPSASAHGQIYSVAINGSEVKNYSVIPDIGSADASFTVYFNKPVRELENNHLKSVFYDTINNQITSNNIELSNGAFNEDNTSYSFTVDNTAFLKNSLGYIVLVGFEDQEGFEVPDFTIGQQNAINRYGKLYQQGLANTYIPPAEVISNRGGFVPEEEDLETLESLSELGDLSYLGAYTSLAKTWELGVMAGASNYMGDMVSNLMDKDDFHLSLGIYGQYNISKWFSARLGFLYARISGNDLDERSLEDLQRRANFRNDIFEGSLVAHFHLLQYGISKGEKFSPSIFAGVGVFYHNPQARILVGRNENEEPLYYQINGEDVWINLREVGTEGQTVGKPDNDSSPYINDRQPPKKYSKVAVSIPMGVAFDFIIKKSWIIGLEAGMRFTFTDYLDDISSYYYDRDGLHQDIVDQNSTITGQTGGVFIKDKYTFSDNGTGSNSTTVRTQTDSWHMAQLVSNPSLANLENTPETAYVQGNNATGFASGRRGTVNRDWFAFFGVKISKVFGFNKYKSKQQDSVLMGEEL